MTEIEKKALALMNATSREPYYEEWSQVPQGCISKALIRAIEQHEAFAQEVSDALLVYQKADGLAERSLTWEALTRFIIAKPDPLVEALSSMGWFDPQSTADDIRTAMQARGYEWRKIGEGA